MIRLDGCPFVALFWLVSCRLLICDAYGQQQAIVVSGETQSDSPSSENSGLESSLADQVALWVEALDAPTALERRSAEKALLDAGPEILQWLPSEDQNRSAEASERLSQIRSRLQLARPMQQVITQQDRVSLSGVTTWGAALESLGLDTGVTFIHPLSDSESIEPISANLTFWHALDLLLDQKNLDVNFYGGADDVLQLIRRQEGRPSRVDSAAYSSFFRMEPVSVYSKRTLRQVGLGGVNIAVEVSWAPHVKPVGISFPLQRLSVTLDDGSQLMPQKSGGTIDMATNRELSFIECGLPFQLAPANAERITSLSGVIQSMIPGESKKFEIPLVGGSGAVTLDAMTVTLDSVTQNEDLFQVRFSVELKDAGRSLESHRQWVYENRVYLQRQDGSRLEHLGFEVLRQTDSGFSVNYLFNLDQGPQNVSLIYESPTSVSSAEFEFELKEIPLP